MSVAQDGGKAALLASSLLQRQGCAVTVHGGSEFFVLFINEIKFSGECLFVCLIHGSAKRGGKKTKTKF